MDSQHVALAFDALFLIAAVGPVALVVIYRIREVPVRRAEITEVMSAAFGTTTNAERNAAKQAMLRNNPYISDPETTFDRCHSPWRYVFPLLILGILSSSIAYIGRAWTYVRLGLSPHNPAATFSSVVIMALAGGFVWSLYQIVSRIGAGELGPADLYEIDLGVIAAVPIGYAFSQLTDLEGVGAFLAFAASAFPVREVSSIVRQYATRKMLESAVTPASRPAERHLGTAIEGLSDQTLARLGELRITTVLDMAYSDPVKIMVQTGFALPVIIDWVDQSIWALYAGDLKGEFARYGLRCSLDVCEFVDMHLQNEDGTRRDPLVGADQDALLAVAKKLDVEPTLAKDLFFRIYADPQVRILRELWYPTGVPGVLTAR